MMRVLVDMVDDGDFTRYAAISVGYMKYSTKIEIEDEQGDIENDVEGLLMYDFEGHGLCIRDISKDIAEEYIARAWHQGYVDLRGYGHCEYI